MLLFAGAALLASGPCGHLLASDERASSAGLATPAALPPRSSGAATKAQCLPCSGTKETHLGVLGTNCGTFPTRPQLDETRDAGVKGNGC